MEKQLRVWVHGDDFVLLLLESARWRIEEFLDLLDTTTVYKASECLAGSWNGLLKASLGRQTPDILNSSGNRSA